ncbi:MAG: DUF4834 family protein [Dysgonamonadaceae bacterium]|jgi:hypothetical protein|nr:DUF4834 family protein [Dysgonamonadaceae bacterium]
MIHFLFFIFLLIVFLLIFGISIIQGIIRFLFGGFSNQSSKTREKNYNDSKSTNQRNTDQSFRSQSKKIIDSDEGEYIEFEEIKD